MEDSFSTQFCAEGLSTPQKWQPNEETSVEANHSRRSATYLQFQTAWHGSLFSRVNSFLRLEFVFCQDPSTQCASEKSV